MGNAEFFLKAITTAKGEKGRCIEITTIEGIEYVHLYVDGRVIPIPYEFLVCFTVNHIDKPKPAPPNVAAFEKMMIKEEKKEWEEYEKDLQKISQD